MRPPRKPQPDDSFLLECIELEIACAPPSGNRADARERLDRVARLLRTPLGAIHEERDAASSA